MKSYILNLLLVSFLFVGCNKSNDEEESQETILPFTVTSYSPQEGKVDATVTINGNNFSTTISEITVTFNGIEASVISATETEIKTVVPSSLPHGDSSIVLKINNETKPVGNFTVSLDDYSYLVIGSIQSKIYSFGNNSGEYRELGRIEYSSQITNMIVTSNSNSPSKIFITASNISNNSGSLSELIIYDKESKLTTSVVLNIPNSIKGPHQVIMGMAWDSDNNRLVACITPDYQANWKDLQVIFINPDNFEVIDSGITIPPVQTGIHSFLYSSNRIYFSSGPGIFIDVNLINNTYQIHDFNDSLHYIWRISESNEENILYAFRSTSGSNAIIPVKLNLTQNEMSDLAPYNGYSITSFPGNGFYDTFANQSVQIIRDNSNGHLLYRFNENSEDLIPTNYPGYEDNLLILGIIE